MKILINGALTYTTKLALKRLIDTGHDVHYSNDAPIHTPAEPGEYDWRVAGVTVVSNQSPANRPQPLSMALKQITSM